METIKSLLQKLNCFGKRSKGRNGKTQKKQDKVTQTDQSPHQLSRPIDEAPGMYYANQPSTSDQDTRDVVEKQALVTNHIRSCHWIRTATE